MRQSRAIAVISPRQYEKNMSKKRATPTPRPATPAPRTAAAAREVGNRTSASTPTPFVPRDEVYPIDARPGRLFWGLAGAILLIMIWMGLRVGVNGDDSFQVDYSNKLLAYYGSGGADTSALNVPAGNMHFYGGFFDIVAGVVNKTLGYTDEQAAFHNVRHLLNVGFGWGAMVITALLAGLIAGRRAAFLTLIFMFLSPRFLGDSLMNPKDIPYAFGNVLALFGMFRVFKKMPEIDRWGLVCAVAGMAIAEATRAGGILLFAYFGLFAAVDFLFKNGFGGLSQTKTVGRYALVTIGSIVVAHILAILFWPYALQSPIGNPLAALTNFAQLGIKIRLLFGGDNIMSDKTHWDYAIQWIFRTIPLFSVLGFGAAIIFARSMWKNYPRLGVFMVFFSVVFPILYIIYKDSTLHDGWRHLTFVYPGIAMLAALAAVQIEKRFALSQGVKYGLFAVLGLLLLEPAQFIARNSHYPYVYFNPISGGMKGAYGNYETDYWGTSTRQAVEWLEANGKISPAMTDTVTIATNYLWNVQRYVNDRYKGKVKVAYLKYNRRYDYAWDYAIFPCRFISAAQLRNGTWPPTSSTIHTIKANNVPICAILQDSTGYAFAAEAAAKQQRFAEADSLYQLELKIHPDNEVALISLGQLMLSTQQPDKMKLYANKVLEINPEEAAALNFIAMEQLQSGKINEGLETLRRNIELNDDNYLAYYYTGVAQKGQGKFVEAAENLTKALEIAPQFKQGYALLAEVYQQQGNTQMAQKVMEVMQQMGAR
jgi:tetratricopeptide (TPR) repeat protein